jgi:RHS repeat-associated protein
MAVMTAAAQPQHEPATWHDPDHDGLDVARYHFLHDANFNVVAMTDTSHGPITSNTVERYHYSPYGEVTVLDADYSPEGEVGDSAPDDDGLSDIDNEFLYTGRRLDPETGLYQYRHRYYHAQMGRFGNRDPIGYRGGMNLYAYVGGRPTFFVDPSGMDPPVYGPPAPNNYYGPIRPQQVRPSDLRPGQNWSRPDGSVEFMAGDADPTVLQQLAEGTGAKPGHSIDNGAGHHDTPPLPEEVKPFYESPFVIPQQRPTTFNRPTGAYGSAEVNLAIVGGGISVVMCEDECGCRRTMLFQKWCIGAGLGGSVVPGTGIVNMSGERCRPDSYKGWFFEIGGAVGIVGGGVDIGYDDWSDDNWAPGDLSGTIETGVGISTGFNFKAMWCRYTLINETVSCE